MLDGSVKCQEAARESFERWSTVKEKQVWLAEEGSGQCQSHPPASGEGFGGIVLPFL